MFFEDARKSQTAAKLGGVALGIGMALCEANAAPAAQAPRPADARAGVQQSWWQVPFSVRTTPMVGGKCDASGAEVLRGISHSGWYGDWYLSDPFVRSSVGKALSSCASLGGARFLGYFDTGQMGEYLTLINEKGEIAFNAWTTHLADGTEGQGAVPFKAASWFGYPSFFFRRNDFALGKSWPEPVPRLVTFDGRVLEDEQAFFSDVCTKDITGKLNDDYSSTLTGEKGGRKISPVLRRALEERGVPLLEARADIAGKSGWGTIHLCNVDNANRLYLRQLIAQIRWVYGKPLKVDAAGTEQVVLGKVLDGVHLDDFGSIPYQTVRKEGFGDWSVQRFKTRISANAKLKSEFELACRSTARQTGFDVATADVSAIRKCFADLYAAHRNPRKDWQSDFWLTFRPFKLLLISHQEAASEYFSTIYNSMREVLTSPRGPLVTGNFVPLLPGRMGMAGIVDLPLFEWKHEGAYASLGQPAGYPGGFAFLGRLAARGGRADYSVVSLYVPKSSSGTGGSGDERMIETAHRILFFELLANRMVMDSGHQFRDGYPPGTATTVREMNEFVSRNKDWLRDREMVADYGVVFSPDSQIVSVSFDRFFSAVHNDEYYAWANLLTRRNKQWDVVLPDDIDNGAGLKRYKAIVLPGVISLSPALRQALIAYARGGGVVLASGVNGRMLGRDVAFAEAPRAFPEEASAAGADLIACSGFLHARECGGDEMLKRVRIPETLAGFEGIETEASGSGSSIFLRVSRRRTGAREVFVDINRYVTLDKTPRDLSANERPLRFTLALPHSESGCLAADTLDENPQNAPPRALPWVTLRRSGDGRHEITVKPGALRVFGSVRLRPVAC